MKHTGTNWDGVLGEWQRSGRMHQLGHNEDNYVNKGIRLARVTEFDLLSVHILISIDLLTY